MASEEKSSFPKANYEHQDTPLELKYFPQEDLQPPVSEWWAWRLGRDVFGSVFF